jgi:3-oxoacyl-[acyl-carrier protein] reductase
MDLGLQGRVAIVCAASSGLGRAAAIGFAREGANVVICSRNKGRLDEAAEEIGKTSADSGARVVPVVADLTRAADIDTLVATALREFRRVDVLVTNAGGPPVAQFPELTDATWESGVSLTLMSAVRCIRAVLPHMRRRHWGRVVAITSIAAKQPIDDLIISSSLRPGVLGLIKVLANQYGREGILFNCVAPGFILTSRQKEISASRAAKRGITEEAYMAEMAAAVPVGRYGKPEELADMIVFLGSERAGYVNGATVSVDGGLLKALY